jgi:pyruvate/2-oxoglutarate dehydrogenase complex dihydrolipoamide dehydrogenase (E3) component
MKYDAIVIGSGQAGNPLSHRLADHGWKVALVEQGHLGGTCINTGCTPTKTMVHRAQIAHYARNAARWGVHADGVKVDLARIVEQKNQVVESFRAGQQKRIEQRPNLHWHKGTAHFHSPHELKVAGELLESERIFIDTGARPVVPGITGLAEAGYLTNESVMELTQLPDHLMILGGGYIGLEFGQMFRRFGSRVTIIQRGGQLLPREDEDVADAVLGILREDGLDVLLRAEASGAERIDERTVRLVVRTADGERSIDGSHVLLAVGRVPNTERLGLEAAGVATDAEGFVRVNERLETTAPGVYALGDVKGGPAFTHVSYDDFRIIRANLLERNGRTTADRLVPYTVFVDPQLGRIGLTEREAGKAGRPYRVATMPMSNVARALEMDEARGMMKVLVDPESRQLLGAAVLGVEGGELMAVLQLAMMGKVPYDTIRNAVFAHPTLAESLNNLFATLD